MFGGKGWRPTSRASALAATLFVALFVVAGALLATKPLGAVWFAVAVLVFGLRLRDAITWLRASPATRESMRAAELERRRQRLGRRYREQTTKDRVEVVVLVSLLGGFFGFILCGIALGDFLHTRHLGWWYPVGWLAFWASATALGLRHAINSGPDRGQRAAPKIDHDG